MGFCPMLLRMPELRNFEVYDDFCRPFFDLHPLRNKMFFTFSEVKGRTDLNKKVTYMIFHGEYDFQGFNFQKF